MRGCPCHMWTWWVLVRSINNLRSPALMHFIGFTHSSSINVSLVAFNLYHIRHDIYTRVLENTVVVTDVIWPLTDDPVRQSMVRCRCKLSNDRECRLQLQMFAKTSTHIHTPTHSSKVGHRWVPRTSIYNKSTMVQGKVWCPQATSYYMSQYWPSFVSRGGDDELSRLMHLSYQSNICICSMSRRVIIHIYWFLKN